jgi:hypothetical protein
MAIGRHMIEKMLEEMVKLLRKAERLLMRLVVLCLVVVVVAQGLMTDDTTRFYMSWSERMEGQNLPSPVVANHDLYLTTIEEDFSSPQTLLTIKLNQNQPAPAAKILINGQSRYHFSRTQVTLRVNAGDTVEIDTRDCHLPLEFKIDSASKNLAYPNPGQVFSGNQSIVMIGRIIVK